jgi:hypothetical protein
MKTLRSLIVSLCLVTAPVSAAPPPKVVNAADGIFTAFQNHPLVGIGDIHGLAQGMDFDAALIRDPRFAREVGNIVLEVGGAAQQATVDRYVNGENIPYPQLRKIWTDVVGWLPTVTYSGLVNIYATVREVNQTLPPEKRIKVWLGEPPVDWTQIRTNDDWLPLLKQRDIHAAELIEREILAKNEKALVIYGGGHFTESGDLGEIIKAKHPKAFFVAIPYSGYAEKSCSTDFEKVIQNWPAPSLIAPIRGSSLEQKVGRPDCNVFPPPRNPSPEQRKQMASTNHNLLDADALLYFGRRDQLKRGAYMFDMILDLELRAEMERRNQIIAGKPLTNYVTDNNPSVNRPWWPN